MTTSERPVPDQSDPDTGEFWRLAQDGRLTYQVCAGCGQVVFYPRAHCPHCGRDDLRVHDSAGDGTLYSYTVIRQTPDPAFRGDAPYIVALVDLAEGFRILTQHRAEPSDPVVGQPVRLEWMTRDDVKLPVFAPLP
jgi:uncharacterized protein